MKHLKEKKKKNMTKVKFLLGNVYILPCLGNESNKIQFKERQPFDSFDTQTVLVIVLY